MIHRVLREQKEDTPKSGPVLLVSRDISVSTITVLWETWATVLVCFLLLC